MGWIIIGIGFIFVLCVAFIAKNNEANDNKKMNYLRELKILDDVNKNLEIEFQKSRVENMIWSKQSDIIISTRLKAIEYERLNDVDNAIMAYLSNIKYCNENFRMNNLSYFANDIGRVIILYSKTKQTEALKSFLIENIEKYPKCRDVDKWEIRLSKLNKDNLTKIVIEPTLNDIIEPKPQNPTIGKQLQNYKDSLPEFNFYRDMPIGMQTFEYLAIYKPVPFEKLQELTEYKERFTSILTKAQIAENQNDIKTAIEYYLELIVEEYEGKEPFERLFIIYRKLKWENKEIETIKRAINFFENLRKNQKDKIISLARKYGMENKALEYINSDKKIQYYGGAFDLYNPYPIINKWKDGLSKLQNKSTKL